MARSLLLASYLVFGLAAHRALAASCYSHDQINAADSPISNKTASLLVACNAAGNANSTCCFSYETCAPDLLCHSRDGSVRRQYCTDPTWQTDQCSPLCPDFDEAGTILTECDDGSYCCGLDNTECCADSGGTKINKSNGQIIAKGQITKSVAPASSTASRTSSSATDVSTSTATSATDAPTSATSPSPSPGPAGPLAATTSSSSGLSGGAKAGIAVGIIAGVALVGGLLFLLFRERSKRKALQEGASGGQAAQQYGDGQPSWGRSELNPAMQGPPQEMSAYEREEGKWHMRGELPDGQGKPQELHS